MRGRAYVVHRRPGRPQIGRLVGDRATGVGRRLGRVTEFEDWPELTAPVLVGAFEGWNDAGDGATSGVEHLELIWDAKPLAAIDPEDYYDFQVNRPDGVAGRRRVPADRVAHDPVLGVPAARRRPTTWCSCVASSPTCAGGRSPRRSST